jgi:hypothetical protein
MNAWPFLAIIAVLVIACVISRLLDGRWWWQYDSDLPYVRSDAEFLERVLEDRLREQAERQRRWVDWREGH